MLQIKNISKQYKTGELIQHALRDVSVSFRDSEFVAVLGPSGSGKTTLLNIIGGLDRYDSGDLVINGLSTKEYKDRDWDTYRNHTIGFIFQSYNLIPHQSVLSNVELALTIAGISKGERRRRAKKALEQVGLGDQLHKKPNQMSGGQMQRVAIARALVNDPDILLADEPTGALDTETSLQVMDLLKEVAKDRLVIMVTHNPELAEKYADRIIKLRDGQITQDSSPCTEETVLPEQKSKKTGKAKMSFGTALSLSFQNLRTKKGRTLLTAFAGSIGIIGIALILALSSGVNAYIDDIQKETMSSYPVTISAETVDLTSVMSSRGSLMGSGSSESDSKKQDAVYADNSTLESSEAMLTSVTENDLTAFKQYLDDPDSEIQQYLGENGVIYTYDVHFAVYAYDSEGSLINTDADTEEITDASDSQNTGMMGGMGGMSSMSSLMSGTSDTSGAENFSELTPGADGTAVSQAVTDSYDVLYGTWPESYDEVVLVLDEDNSIATDVLYQLGFLTAEEYSETAEMIANGEEPSELTWEYSDICGQSFYLVAAGDSYIENADGTFSALSDTEADAETLLENAVELKITGIIRPTEDAANAAISTAVAYTSLLTDYVIDRCNSSAVVEAQEADPVVNVLTGIEFEAADDTAKAEDAINYLSTLGISDKAVFYQMLMYSTQNAAEENGDAADGAETESAAGESTGSDGVSGMTLQTEESVVMDETAMAQALDTYLAGDPDEDFLISVYDEYVSGATYEDNMAAFVAVSLIVSCIMIGIITHISVLERTREIGILRALGASRRNISQVFNAETFIIGFCAGLLGVGVSSLLTIPVNAVIRSVLGTGTITASLPAAYAAVLIILSMLITMFGGLLPARRAAKKDPVIALRTE